MAAKEKDLRYIKTEKIIEESYLKLKDQGNFNIKVNDLCSSALINKSTFYDHYENIEQLDDYLCKKVITEILDGTEYIRDFFKNTQAFVHNVIIQIEQNRKKLTNLFGSNENKAINLVENYLFKIYLKDEKDEDLKMKIIFAIGGGARLFIRQTTKIKEESLTRLLKKILEID